MKQKLSQFFISAFLYWFVASFAHYVFNVPEKIVVLAVFVPPLLGLMWGIPAAIGVYVGGLFVIPEFNNLLSAGSGVSVWFTHFIRGIWVFLAGSLPYTLWHKWMVHHASYRFSLSVHTFKKFLLILFVTFFVTSIFRTLTATPEELAIVSNLIAPGNVKTFLTYFSVCLADDFFLAIFFDLACFFFLISKGFSFYNPAINASRPHISKIEKSSDETQRAWLIGLGFYLIFPVALAYIGKYQIYGVTRMEIWLRFVAECLTVIDAYLLLMFYLLLRYRRSIMLEVVFLVTQTVFLSASVLGLGSSVAMGEMVKKHANESLSEMNVICRERLQRTFFCVRQAVNGMKLQALNSIESYDKLVGDAAYRKSYIEKMKKDLSFIPYGIDGSIAYYLRLAPEIDGTKGGFSMQREEARWEGLLSPFVEREPMDLAAYDPDDIANVGWFYTPMKSKTDTWIEPYADALVDFYVISYVAPLYLDGKFIGVIGMDIDFNFIIQELRRMSIYDYDYVYITDRNGTVLYHRYQKQGSQFQPNPEFQEMEVYLANGMWLGIATPLSKIHDERDKVLMHMIATTIIVAILISVGSIVLAAKSIKPLSGMTEAAKRIASGDLNVKISYESGNELGILVRSIREMAAKLEIYVYRDKLTGLRNAAAYISKAAELDAQSKIIPDLNYAVIVFDANFLKKVNDKYGHEAGNELLRHAAQVISKVFENSPVYRVGGDEFAAILEGEDYENRNELLKIFDEKVDEEHFNAGGDTLTVSVARGIGVYEHGMEFSNVSKTADVAMYSHKAALKAKFGEDVR